MAIKLGAGVSTLRPVLFFFRFMQWASAVIVMGIASSYIHKYNPEGEHIVYAEVIVSLPFSGPNHLTRRTNSAARQPRPRLSIFSRSQLCS
jgi:hypothetical protein